MTIEEWFEFNKIEVNFENTKIKVKIDNNDNLYYPRSITVAMKETKIKNALIIFAEFVVIHFTTEKYFKQELIKDLSKLCIEYGTQEVLKEIHQLKVDEKMDNFYLGGNNED